MIKALWRDVQPNCSLSGGRISQGDFWFIATRMLDVGVKVDCVVRGWKIDDVSCSMRVRMGLYDKRVTALRSTAMGLDLKGVGFLDFDVLAASSVMDGDKILNSPLIGSQARMEEFASIVEDYSRRIDRIWGFVGGVSVESLERLAIWAMRNRDRVGTLSTTMGDICAAFVYGERQLAHELIAELRTEWERRVKLEPRDAVFEVYDNVRQALERLQDAVRARATH